jgi:amino acid transporter
VEERKVFVRNATGLVRDVSGWASMFGNWGIVTSGAAVFVIATLYTAPGANWDLDWFIGFVPSLTLGVLYVIISASMPRSGSDYVFVTRVLHPAAGFISSFAYTAAVVLGLGTLTYTGTTFFGYLFSSLGLAYSRPDLVNLASYILTPTVAFSITALILILGGLIAFLPPKNAWRFVFWGGMITLGSIIVFFVTLSTISVPTFKAAYDAFAATGNYTSYDAILAKGAVPSPGLLAASVLALPAVWFSYALYNSSSAWAGETKNIRRSAWTAIIGSLILAAVYYVLFTTLSFRAFGQNFLEAWSNLSAHGASPLPGVGAFVPYFAYLVHPNPILLIVMFIAVWLPFLYQVPVFIIMQTRYLFSWAWDRILPERIAAVSDRFHTPVLANVIITAGGLLVAYLVAFVPQMSLIPSTIPIFTFVFMIPCVAAMVFPYLRKDLYRTTIIVTKKIAGVPILTWLGAATLIYLIVSDYLAWVGGTLLLTATTGETYLAIYGIGAVIFVAGYYGARRRGIPIELVFKEIPPE